MKQERWKSPVLWGAMVAQALSILVALGVIDLGMSETIQGVAAGILQLLVLFGVVNDPTSKDAL